MAINEAGRGGLFWGALEAVGALGALFSAVGVAVALFGGGGGAKAESSCGCWLVAGCS